MFCPSCGKQNKDTAVFCEFCDKALPQKTVPSPVVQTEPPVNDRKKAETAKPRLSFNAKKGIVTGILIVAVVLVVLVIYYPNVFHW